MTRRRTSDNRYLGNVSVSEGGLDLKQLTAHCGAEVRGIDLARTLDGQTVESLVAALAERFYQELAAVAERHAAESEEHAHLRLEFVPGGSGGSKAE